MASLAASSSPSQSVFLSSSTLFSNSNLLFRPVSTTAVFFKPTIRHLLLGSPAPKTIRATLGENAPVILQEEQQPNEEIRESVKVLKIAAKTRKVSAEEIPSALSVIEKSKLDPSTFFENLGGSESPGKTWMLIYTAEFTLALLGI